MADPCYTGCDDYTPLYRASDSSTSKVSTTPFTIQYGSGGANGVLVNDLVQMGGFSVNQVSRLFVSSLSFLF